MKEKKILDPDWFCWGLLVTLLVCYSMIGTQPVKITSAHPWDSHAKYCTRNLMNKCSLPSINFTENITDYSLKQSPQRHV